MSLATLLVLAGGLEASVAAGRVRHAGLAG